MLRYLWVIEWILEKDNAIEPELLSADAPKVIPSIKGINNISNCIKLKVDFCVLWS